MCAKGPMLSAGLETNPFKSSVRLYPVELPFISSRSYQLTIDIPPGFALEELPKSSSLRLSQSAGSYEYTVNLRGDKIQINSLMILNSAIFEPEDYEELKNFYANIIRL